MLLDRAIRFWCHGVIQRSGKVAEEKSAGERGRASAARGEAGTP